MKTTRKSTQKSRVHKDYLIPDALWNEIQPLLPKHVTHYPLGCHRKRVDDRSAMNAIFFVLKTGCQWNALNATGICSSSSAHRRFQEWNKAGVFKKLWKKCLGKCKAVTRASVPWMERWGKHRLRGKKRGPNPTDRAKQGVKRSLLTEGQGIPIGLAIDGANRNDFRMAKETITSIPIKRPKPTKKKRQGRCMDKGYDFDEVRMLLQL